MQGYALDALEHDREGRHAPPSLHDARSFLALLLTVAPSAAPAVGLGETLSLAFGSLAGTGLRVDGEVVTLTAFAHSA